MAETTLPATLRRFASEVLLLARTLEEGEEIQWTPAPVPAPRDDTTEHSKGGPANNPTLQTVLDERRLKVREAVVQAHYALEESIVSVVELRHNLEGAIASWNGA